ncbi:hypothetical protein [Pedobacter nanyangensis]|uniref:hypothetical protein n=1 Tax=Pedobacter nanyangensis TaxID=1562389 RepID=UPI0013B46ED2|nr:hypothetical protein [Pedobacter nanyangensis]
MKTKLFLFSALVSTMMFTLVSCKKDKADDPTKVYPKNVSIEYKCTVASGTPSGLSIIYSNESGGSSTLTNVVLPFSKKINRTVNANDDVTMGFTGVGPGGVKGEIYVDGKLVDSKTASSNSSSNSFTETVLYVWQ